MGRRKAPAQLLDYEAAARLVGLTPKKLLSVRACAAEIGYEYKALRNLIDRDKVPYYKVGRSVRLDPAEVLARLGQHHVDPPKVTP